MKKREKRYKMKSIVRILIATLIVSLLVLSFASCDLIFPNTNDNSDGSTDGETGGNNDEEAVAKYTVTVVDGLGKPVSDVVLKLTNDSGVNKLAVSDKYGVATFNNMTVGTYSVAFEKIPDGMVLLESEYEVTAEKKEISVVLCSAVMSEAEEVYGNVPNSTLAHHIDPGAYKVTGEANSTAYFIFRPSTKGIYKFSFTSADSDMTVGYYGNPMFVLAFHALDGDYDGKSFEITVQETSTPYVIGLNFVSGGEAVLKVERIDDAPFDPKYEPWTNVEATEDFKTFTTGTLTDLDITDPTLSVALGDDGYYYTADGKLVYIRIATNKTYTSPYLDGSIALIAGYENPNVGNNFGGYVYDENGEFVGKYSYNEMIGAYYEHVDANGVYPLTAELAEAVKCHGNSVGWLDSESYGYLFEGVDLVEENAWLFLCCTAE